MIRLIAIVGFLLLALTAIGLAVQPNTILLNSQCPDVSTSLLLHFDGTNGSTTFTDVSRYHNSIVLNAGTVALNTTTKKFGTAAAAFTANGSNIASSGTGAGAFDLLAGNFTIDFWAIPPTGTGGGNVAATNQFTGSTGWNLGIGSSTQKPFMQMWNGASTIGSYTSTSSLLTQSVFNHVAWVRNGTTILLFVGGVSQTLSVGVAIGGASIPASSGSLEIGNVSTFQPAPNIDEFRISKIARWTSNFTPPTAAYCPLN